MNRKRTGMINGYFAIMILCIAVFVILELTRNNILKGDTSYTLGRLKADLNSGKVENAVIRPNSGSDSGSVKIALSDGTQKSLYVTDVKEAETLLRAKGIDAIVADIPGENYVMTVFIPIIVGIVVMVLIWL